MIIRFRSNKQQSQQDTKSNIENDQESKNDLIMKHVWRFMKYTQGENDQKIKMKFIMPVFVHVDTLSDAEDREAAHNAEQVEITIMVSLPPEYQKNLDYENDANQVQPPKPIDDLISFEILAGFEGYVR
jgi:hypothetical protein